MIFMEFFSGLAKLALCAQIMYAVVAVYFFCLFIEQSVNFNCIHATVCP